MAVVHPDQVRRLVAVSMPHPRRLRRAHLTDVAAGPGQPARPRLQRPVLPERRLVGRRRCRGRRALLRHWAGPGWPDAETEARYRQAAQIPGVAHCALESYRWAVRSIPRPDGLRYARRMRTPVTVPDPAAARRAGPLRAAAPARRAPAGTSRRRTAGG